MKPFHFYCNISLLAFIGIWAGFDIGAWCLFAWQTAKRKTFIREIPGQCLCGRGLGNFSFLLHAPPGRPPARAGESRLSTHSVSEVNPERHQGLFILNIPSASDSFTGAICSLSCWYTAAPRHSVPLGDGTGLESAPQPRGQHPCGDAEQLSAWQGCSTWQPDKGLRSRRKTRLGGKVAPDNTASGPGRNHLRVGSRARLGRSLSGRI